jgi:hypothetical protein
MPEPGNDADNFAAYYPWMPLTSLADCRAWQA